MKKYLSIAFLLFCSTAASAQTLKLSLNKGDKYEITTSAGVSTTQSAMGQALESKADSISVESIEIKDVRGSEIDLARTTTRLVVKIDGSEQNASYDSARTDNDPKISKELAKNVGQIKLITISENGKILKEPPAEIDNTVMVGGTISPSDLGFLRESILGREMKLNNSWEFNSAVEVGKISIITKGVYIVTAVDGGIATISFGGTQQTNGKIIQMELEIAINGSTSLNDQLKVDLNTGIILEISSTSEGTTNTEIQGMSIPITTKKVVSSKIKALF